MNNFFNKLLSLNSTTFSALVLTTILITDSDNKHESRNKYRIVNCSKQKLPENERLYYLLFFSRCCLCLQYQFEFQIQMQTNFIRLLDYHSYKRCSVGFRSKLWYYVLHLHAWVNFDVYPSYIFYHMALCFFRSAECLACNSMCICFRRNSIFPCDFHGYLFSKSNKRNKSQY